MWPDNETLDDLIGFQVHADLIRTVVTTQGILPVTIGVFGDWGSGKTSIMKMLERDLNSKNWPDDSEFSKIYGDVAVLYFNTWLLEGYDDAKAAILSSVLLQLGEHQRFGPKIRDKIVSLLKSINIMRLTKLTMNHVALPAAAALFTGGAGAIPAAMSVSLGIGALGGEKGAVDKTHEPRPPRRRILTGANSSSATSHLQILSTFERSVSGSPR